MPSRIPPSLFRRSLALLLDGQGVQKPTTAGTVDQLDYPFFSSSSPALLEEEHIPALAFAPATPLGNGTMDVSHLYHGRANLSRPNQIIVTLANWLSLIGSLIIILHIPRVVQRVPAQRKRMIIILFTAISNFGFALANVVTDITSASTYLQCSVSAWCYVFFQLLTCTLVIVGTFRLCGVFLFTERRSVPSKYIAICPIVAFTLATTPAAAGHFNFDECGHYCWFIPTPDQHDCKVHSLWAWLCFYAWMILFLTILFGSTLFVMVKIAITVMHSRSDLKQVANQTRDFVTVEDAPTTQAPSTMKRLRSMSQSLQSRTASLFSIGSRQRGSTGSQQLQDHDTSAQEEALHDGEQNQAANATSRALAKATDNRTSRASFGLDSPTLRDEGILAPATTGAAALTDYLTPTQEVPQSTRAKSPNNLMAGAQKRNQDRAVLRAKERPFLVAILRQALYPISISVSGCIQIIVDLTLADASDYEDALDYFANVATSIQGFLFFLVFMFDPAVVQTRRHWRKYMIWKYYVEFYYSLGMPHEGRDFQDQFIERCESLNRDGKEAKFDQLTKTPPYSWSLQYDDLAMPSDFQTTYPLTSVISNANGPAGSASGRGQSGLPRSDRRGSGGSGGMRVGRGAGDGNVFMPTALPDAIPEADEMHLDSTSAVTYLSDHDQQQNKASRAGIALRTDYTYSFPDLSSDATLPPRNPDKEDTSIHPMVKISIMPDDNEPTTVAGVRKQQDEGVSRSSVDEISEKKVEGRDTGAVGQDGQEIIIETRRSEPQANSLSSLSHHATFEATVLPPPAIASATRLSRPRSFRRESNRGRFPSIALGSDGTHSDLYDPDFDLNMDAALDRPPRSTQPTYLSAPQPGDVLSFPRLTKVTTIGGGDGNMNANARRYRTTPGRPSKSSSGRTPTFGSYNVGPRSSTMHGTSVSLSERLRLSIKSGAGHTSKDAIQSRYQRQFLFPRCAYVMHMIVRQIYIPREARMPPILNPFRRESARQNAYQREMSRHDVEGGGGELFNVRVAGPSARGDEEEELRRRRVSETTLPDPIHPGN